MCTSQNEEIRLNKDNKILSRTKLEAFAEHNFSVVQIMIYGLDWVENIVTSIFFLSHNVFKNLLLGGR